MFRFNNVVVRQKIPKLLSSSGIIHIFAVESHDIVEHLLGLNSRTVGVELNSLYVAVDGFVPLPCPTGLIAFQIPLFSSHN